MNILHISDLHFGPYHWRGNNEILLKKINSYNADIVINTGDVTSDSLESEFSDAGAFLDKIRCNNILSIMGNHDKYSKRSHEMFKKYIFSPDIVIEPPTDKDFKKKYLYLKKKSVIVDEYFTDINYLKTIKIGNKTVLAVCIDSCFFQRDYGWVEESIMKNLSLEISKIKYDTALLLIHHSILATDEDPLVNSQIVIDLINRHKIKNVFCGHTHQMDLRQSYDLNEKHEFIQFMCGTTSSVNIPKGYNMFYFYKNVGEENLEIHPVKYFIKGDDLEFQEEKII
jgi:predicted phosphodiesterase